MLRGDRSLSVIVHGKTSDCHAPFLPYDQMAAHIAIRKINVGNKTLPGDIKIKVRYHVILA